MVNGRDGKVRARARLPEVSYLELMRNFDFSYECAALRGGAANDIIAREWRKDCGGGGRWLWAYNADLEPLWQTEVDPPYGHHNAMHCCDLTGDGRTEILAGGSLVSADGEILWQHDYAEEMRRTVGGGHYDACLAGAFSGDPETDPVAFLAGGSAGLYVVDALTGVTRAVHRVGHAQWALPCRVRDDLPGQQAMVGTRWGNYGILTLFSGKGERLWTMQPDYVLQGSQPVQWAADGPQHIWVNTSREAFGLYDGYGRFVHALEPMRHFYTGLTKMPCTIVRPKPESTDHLAIRSANVYHIFKAQQ